MDGRQRLGVVLLVVGIGCIGVGGVGLATGGSGSGTASATPPPASGVATSTPPGSTAQPSTEAPPSVVPTTAATVEPTSDTLGLVRAFFDRLQAAIRSGTQADLVDRLGDATIERYGRDACATHLAGTAAVPEEAFEILGIRDPGPWDYTTDGLTTTVPDAIAVDANVTAPDASGTITTTQRELHVQIVAGEVRWFTDCGTPIGLP